MLHCRGLNVGIFMFAWGFSMFASLQCGGLHVRFTESIVECGFSCSVGIFKFIVQRRLSVWGPSFSL